MIMIQVEVDVPAYATFKDTITATIKVTRSLHWLFAEYSASSNIMFCPLSMSSPGQLCAGQTCQGNRDHRSVSQIQVWILAANFPGAPQTGIE